MNRDYKFRAFFNGKMFYKNLTDKLWKLEKIPINIEDIFFYATENDENLPIMQYTGIEDVDRVEIWEDDIVESDDCIGVIKYDDDIAAFVLKPFNKEKDELFLGNKFHCFKIIGNIHQNNNFLEKGV